MSYMNEQKRTLSFRRLPFAAKRRRARPAMAALRRVSKAVLLLSPLILFATWLLASAQFRLAEVETVGAGQVDPAWVEHQLQDVAGRNLLLLDLDGVQERLSVHPWISKLRVEKQLPRRLVITLEEHVPAAILVADEGAFLLSDRGGRIVELAGDLDEVAINGRLVIDGRSTNQAASQLQRVLALASDLERGSTRWARRPERVRILSPEDLEFTFSDAAFVVRLRQGQAQEVVDRQVSTVDELLPQLRDRLGEIEAIDLRFDRRIVLVPKTSTSEPPSEPNQDLVPTGIGSQSKPEAGKRGTMNTAELNRSPLGEPMLSQTIRPLMTSPLVAQRG